MESTENYGELFYFRAPDYFTWQERTNALVSLPKDTGKVG